MDLRDVALSLSGQPVWVPTPEPAEELDADKWIALLLEHDSRGIRTEQREEEPDYKAMIIEVLADGGEYSGADIADMIDLDAKRTGVLLRTMRDNDQVENGDGLRINGRPIQTWRTYTEPEAPEMPLEKFLLDCKPETVKAVSLLQRVGPMTVSDIAERIGVSIYSVYRWLRPVTNAGYVRRKRRGLYGLDERVAA